MLYDEPPRLTSGLHFLASGLFFAFEGVQA